MKKSVILSIAAILFMSVIASGQDSGKLVSSKTNVKFFSTTPAEDIEANNTASVSTINLASGEIIFSVPMQGFQFEKSLMQKHFNGKDFLDTKSHPKAKLKARITNNEKINYTVDGIYSATVEGDLTIKGVTKQVSEAGTITVMGDAVKVDSKFNVMLADYGIAFLKGKPSSNIAKTVEVTVVAEYKK